MENKDYKIIGLTTREADERIAKYGRNEIDMERPPRVRVLLSKFWGLAPLDARTNHYFRFILVTILIVLLTVVLATQGWLIAPIEFSLVLILAGLAITFLVVANLFKVMLGV
uniref:Cation-transporting P-type ATPase N-terminal domain-containing protein n=1 Tax=Thermogladius calderae TaxID=1200300 RepID=A0A7J3Y129_9CREN